MLGSVFPPQPRSAVVGDALALRVHRPEAAGRGAVAGLRGLLEPSCGERPVLLDAAA